MTFSSGFTFPPACFVTGTDTDVGKSVVSALLTLGLGATYWKPIQSGAPHDRDFVRRVTGLADAHFLPERFCLTQPLSPHAAAAIDGVEIRLQDFALPPVETSHLIVEGAGGLLVPINSHHYMTDLIQHLGLPVVLVARSTLGTINHTLLSIECLRQRGIPLLGVVLNGPCNPGNREAIAQYGQTQVLAELEFLPAVTPQTLGDAWASCWRE